MDADVLRGLQEVRMMANACLLVGKVRIRHAHHSAAAQVLRIVQVVTAAMVAALVIAVAHRREVAASARSARRKAR